MSSSRLMALKAKAQQRICHPCKFRS